MYWIYKCNSRNRPHQVAYGDWNEFFRDLLIDGQASEWGSTELIPALADASRGDTVLAYQTDRNELVGVARVVRLSSRGELILKPLRRIGVKVRPLKKMDARVAAIPALQPGRIRTLYDISRSDAQVLIRAAGERARLERRASRAEVLSSVEGGGFGQSAENKAVELAAVRHVVSHFRINGWNVRDVSRDKVGYDLVCVRKSSRLHVEVKGVSGSKRQFIITRAERQKWMVDKLFVLALVTKARSAKPQLDLSRGPESTRLFQFDVLSFIASG